MRILKICKVSRIFFVTIFILSTHYGSSQGISAEYDCNLSYPSGVSLKYSGNYYYQDNRSISYLIPEYLIQYPDGNVERNGNSYVFSTDSIQHILLVNLDSGKYESYIYPRIYRGKFGVFNGEWQLTTEILEISGYKCQHAYWVSSNGKDTLTEIWFTADIPCPTGFEVWTPVPGLVIKLKNKMGLEATLRKVRIGDTISPEVFIRKELE